MGEKLQKVSGGPLTFTHSLYARQVCVPGTGSALKGGCRPPAVPLLDTLRMLCLADMRLRHRLTHRLPPPPHNTNTHKPLQYVTTHPPPHHAPPPPPSSRRLLVANHQKNKTLSLKCAHSLGPPPGPQLTYPQVMGEPKWTADWGPFAETKPTVDG